MSSPGSTCATIQVRHVLFSEPVGSTGPKFLLNTDGLRQHSVIEASLSLSCPAQAFPVPIYRYRNADKGTPSTFLIIFSCI